MTHFPMSLKCGVIPSDRPVVPNAEHTSKSSPSERLIFLGHSQNQRRSEHEQNRHHRNDQRLHDISLVKLAFKDLDRFIPRAK